VDKRNKGRKRDIDCSSNKPFCELTGYAKLGIGVKQMVANLDKVSTIEDLLATPDDGNIYELLEGVIYVSRAPSLKHQRVIKKLSYYIEKYLEQSPIGETYPTPGVIFGEHDSAIPDLIYISNEGLKEIGTGIHIEGSPDLIVEVVSPGSDNIKRDRDVKLRTYRRHSVKEYWIADPDNLTLEVYRGGNLTLAATLTIDDELTTPLLPGFTCKVRDIFAQPSFS
jgi:Uma2 family endonuclease